jgi:hypothetical protein
MDKLKVKLSLTDAERATDALERAIADYDHKQIGGSATFIRSAASDNAP